MNDHDFEWREAQGLPIEYCVTHGRDARRCRAEDAREPLDVAAATRRVYWDDYSGGESLSENSFLATIEKQEFRVTVTPLCMSRFMPETCPNDTNGDGDCGQQGCPICGVPEARKPYRCAGDRDHDGMHADKHGTFNWTDADEVTDA